ncbi:double-stranded RNA-specific editase Adar isoform X2 [Anopheles darlingi]|uniref:double-stranded RNA-specific editase Adar isoform X2 n=1 Tax=Anopheles darlingi TaxID=43151 RepID=UPI0021006869|nr:double-stranded RNA-specific editase Adar isoform X2 [Anopheles darlingi]
MMSNNSSSNINKNKSNNNCSSTTASSLKSSNTTSNSSSSSSISRKINTISNNSNAVNKKHTSSGSGNSYTTHSGTGTGGGGNSHGTTMPGATSRRVAKRKASTVNIPPTVRKRRKIQHLPKPGDARQEQVPQTKNTVAVLNELKRNLVYNVESQTGPVHAPLFTISVVVDGQKFVGTGPSKKLARVAAAASALRSFIQFKDGATLTPIEPLQNVDFTSDDPMIENSIFPLSDTVAGGAGCGVLHEPLSVVTNGKPLPDVASAVAAGAGAATATAAISGNSSNNTNKYSSNSNSYSTGGSSSSISNSNSASSNINSVHTQHTVASSSIGNSSGRGSQAKYNHSGRQSNADTTTHALAHVKGGVRGGTSGGNVGNNGSVLRPGPDGATRDAAASAAGEKIGTAALDRHLPHHQQAPAAVAGHGGVETVRLLSVTAGATAPVAAAAGAAATTAVAASSLTTNKLKVSAANIARSSGPGAGNATGHHPKSQPEKGPVMLLHELFTDAHFECVSSDGLQHSKFTVVVTVNDNQRFEGTGPSKKMAKNAAAKAALASICNISFSPLQQSKFGLINAGAGNGALCAGSGGLAHNGDSSFKQGKNFELPQTFADAIGKLVIEKFNLVMQSSDVYSRRKVLAGFVMTYGYDVKTARVISLATGTKCVSGEHMSVTGSVINDSHAEIIARRGLMDFIYSQLDLLCRRQADPTSAEDTPAPVVFNGSTTAAGSIMVSANECSAQLGSKEMETVSTEPEEEPIFNKPNSETGLYTLKEGIYFHLYINTAPCGDARVFSPHENDSMDVDKHPNRKARGQLRTKVESGEGTIPVKSSEGIQTWDGVLQGQRLLTMSCSDKISRWNVLGLQGSLLASIIQPIYLHSIVLGSLLHPAHMYRAICGRIENAIQGLPPPYRLNKPKLALMTSAESRNQTKPPNFSINWITDCTEVEIVNSFTGKLINNNTNTSKMSRLSKQSFYRRYTNVIAQLPHVRFRDLKPTYFETKMSVVEYQQAKRELFAAFSKEDLGDWLKKPIEQDQFTLLTAKETDPPSQQQHQPQQQSQQQQQQQQVQQHGIQQLPQLLSPSSSAMPT